MSLNDPVGDMIARIKNAQLRNHKKVELPSSNFKIKIAEVLKNEGYINNFEVSSVGSTEDWYCCAEPTEQHLVAVDFSK